jgi:Uma2 family endonuclease
MPQVVQQPEEMAVSPSRIRWTRALVRDLEKAGIQPSHRYELIQGELIRTSGQTPPVAYAENRLIHWLIDHFSVEEALFHIGIDLEVSDKEFTLPEVDGAILKPSAKTSLIDYPSSDDVEAIVEVAGDTLGFDLSTKARLYALAGIMEYWVVDVCGQALVVHREPVNGSYQSVIRYLPGEEVALLARPDVGIAVVELLPPVAANEGKG